MILTKSIRALFAASQFALAGYPQDMPSHALTADGYISSLQTVMNNDSLHGYWMYESQLQNRLNFNYVPSAALSFSLQLRNRFITGDRFRSDPDDINKKAIAEDPGLADLSFNIARGPSFVLNTSVDRLWMKYTFKQLETTVGRQRINWGLAYVWNPNDWFNNFSFFDVDYMERPGSDAIRLQYFTGALSGAELVVKIDSSGKLTAAGLYKLNKGKYDFQVLGGILSSEDLGLGFGWAGGIGAIGFRGELSYFYPLEHMEDTTGVLLASIALDYSFGNSLTVQVEGLYNQIPSGYPGKSFLEFYQRPLTVKSLSFTEWNFFAQISYPFTSLINGSIAALYFPEVSGYYLGPSITCSLGDDLDFSLIAQWFDGELPGQGRQTVTLGFMRFKYNF
jgi:hypothetical protein